MDVRELLTYSVTLNQLIQSPWTYLAIYLLLLPFGWRWTKRLFTESAVGHQPMISGWDEAIICLIVTLIVLLVSPFLIVLRMMMHPFLILGSRLCPDLKYFMDTQKKRC